MSSSRALGNALYRDAAIANGIGGLLVSGYYGTMSAGDGPGGATYWIANTLGAVGLAVTLMAIGYPIVRRVAFPRLAWLDRAEPPSERERLDTLRLPRLFSQGAFLAWLGAALVSGVGTSTNQSAGQVVVSLVGSVLAALVAITLTYLLVEHELRPVLARALEGRPELRAGGLVMRRRLLLAWALGSGIPLLGVALTPLVRDDNAPLSWGVPVALLATAGILAGAAIALFLARSIADPLTEIHAGLRRVRHGELDTTVMVSDAGEIGLLQSGFNEMVDGLRERERLQDLFGRHVGEDVARRALDEGSALGGERREVTAFFVDLIGSTAMARNRSPEDVVATLNQFFDAVVHAITEHGGWVNKFEGDGALCVFGAPVEQPDHAARAQRAALDLHADLERRGLDAGIGIASGPVVAGNVGTEQRYEYTIIGHTVNVAARLTDQAKRHPQRILSTTGGAGWQPDGAVELRGVGAVDVYAPARGSPAAPAPARWPRTAP